MASFFGDVCMGPPIEVFALTKSFNDDKYAQKVNLGVGAYRTDEGKPFVLPVVKSVEAQMAADKTLTHEYLPIAGNREFCRLANELILGKDSKAITENRVEGIQVQGGTGGIRLAAEFLKRNCCSDVVYVSKPTWGNHKTIFTHAGFSQVREYRYWDPNTCKMDLNGYLEDLENAPEKAVIVLHAVAHNPTGMDPTQEQWVKIAEVIKRKKLFPLLDCAYQGFASGDLDRDAWAVRYFVDQGFETMIAQSFSKNFGLYNERIGNLCIVARTSDMLPNVKSQMEIIVRTTWSNPSNHGARIVASILSNPALKQDWQKFVTSMADRIGSMRTAMYNKLREKKAPGSWEHIVNQIGMFSFTGLDVEQSKAMVDKHHVYMLKSGRISMAGLTTKNVDYVVDAMIDVLTTKGQLQQKL